MDWQKCGLVLCVLLPLAKCWTPINVTPANRPTSSARQNNAASPYIDIVLCPFREQPWSCAREQSGRILDVWDNELNSQWQTLKVEADRQLNATIEKRGYSTYDVPTKEKPSTILNKIEIGSNFLKKYIAETMDGFLGRENDYIQNGNQKVTSEDYDDGNDDEEEDDADEDGEEDTDTDYEASETTQNEEDEDEQGDEKDNQANVSAAFSSNSGEEFIEIEEPNPTGQLKRPGNNNNKNKNKNKNKLRRKKGQKGQKGQHTSVGEQATLLVVQQLEQQHDAHDSAPTVISQGGHGNRKGEKRKKRKKRPSVADSVSTVVVEQAPPSHLGLGLLEELVGAEDLLGGGGKRKRKNKHPSKYGRSNGVTRGKKKKKRKALMKLVLLGSFLKAKIELLLKLLGAHLQIKFFAIALIGLLINIARFWIDVKRGGVPQKVIYVEHAHHQHHYEEHGDDWNEGGGGGGYWKRSLQTDPTVEGAAGEKFEGGYTDSYQPRPQSQYDAQYMAYRNQWQ